jgi:hypothetical protein
MRIAADRTDIASRHADLRRLRNAVSRSAGGGPSSA